MEFKTLKDKCKYYQKLFDYKLMPNGYIIAHLDGRSFSKLIKNRFNKPFDDNFIDMMNKTALFLCNNVSEVKCAYVQSDEISLFIKNELDSDLLFSGRLCKLQSILASMATTEFNKQFILHNIKENNNDNIVDVISKMQMVQFDCKIWNVPNWNEVKAWFLFRRNDCVRNSKQQTAQTWCTHKELLGKQTDEQIQYLKEKCHVDWEKFSVGKKYGRFFTKEVVVLTKVIDEQQVNFERSKWVEYSGLEIENYFDEICLKGI